MARMTRSELLTNLGYFNHGLKDEGVQLMANMILLELSRQGFSFGKKRFTVTTLAPVTISDTISVTKGATTVTDSGAAFDETNDPGQVILIDGSSVWYSIDAVAVGGGSCTISSGFAGDTLVNGSCTVAYPRVVLPADVAWMDGAQRPNGDPLMDVTSEVGKLRAYNPTTAEPDRFFYPEILNDDGYVEIFLLDFPGSVYTFVCTGPLILTRFTDTGSSKSGIPEIWEDVLLKGTLYLTWDSDDEQSRSVVWERRFRNGVKQMRQKPGGVIMGQRGSMANSRVLINSWADEGGVGS